MHAFETLPTVNQSYIDVNLTQLLLNLQRIKSTYLQPSTKIAAVVKDNAYGHGLISVCQHLKDHVTYFAINNLYEAQTIQNSGILTPLLVMGPSPKNHIEELIYHNIEFVLYDESQLETIVHHATSQKKKAYVHIKCDFGMNRLGFTTESFHTVFTKDKIKTLSPHVEIKGIMSHLPDAGTNEAQEQLNDFSLFCKNLSIQPLPLCHTANSLTTLQHKESHHDLIRPGIALYGYTQGVDHEIKPCLSLKSTIAMLKSIPAGKSISYNRNFRSVRPMTIAVIPIGYAHGYLRQYSIFGKVIIYDTFAPIVGDICMDMFMVDVSHINNVSIGTPVTLIGKEKNSHISCEDIATSCNMISYEVLTTLSTQLHRRMITT